MDRVEKRIDDFIALKKLNPELKNAFIKLIDDCKKDQTSVDELNDLFGSLSVEPKFTKNEENIYNEFKSTFKSPLEEYNWAKTQIKTCSKCKKCVPLCLFNGNTSGKHPFDKNGIRLRRPECKDCTKKVAFGKSEAVKVAKKLGMSQTAPKGTACEICKSTTRKLVFDHDHKTHRFRGWLCDNCNRSIGMIGEDNLENCINYLKKCI